MTTEDEVLGINLILNLQYMQYDKRNVILGRIVTVLPC